jgi:hypothetical protein
LPKKGRRVILLAGIKTEFTPKIRKALEQSNCGFASPGHAIYHPSQYNTIQPWFPQKMKKSRGVWNRSTTHAPPLLEKFQNYFFEK